MTIVTCPQRSPEWFAARLGRLTGSRVSDAFATIKSGEAAGRRNLRVQLVLERLTGKPQEQRKATAAMERGVQLEADAITAYEVETGILIEPVGFICHDELMAGVSPDGLIGDDGGVEVKCPEAAAHLDYVRGVFPREYRLQCIHGLWLTGRAWWDFVSFHPEFPVPLRLKRTRVTATEAEIAAHELNVRTFLTEVEKEVDAVTALIAATVAA
jgi:hypothetical protein